MKLKITLLANTPITRELGLMHKSPLKKNECAFFDFKKKGKFSFWNKNVSFPISLIFCDEDLKIRDIGFLKEQQLNPVSPRTSDIRYVIEAHEDFPNQFKIKIGDKIKIKENEVFLYGKNS
jgi:uncharacterized protein